MKGIEIWPDLFYTQYENDGFNGNARVAKWNFEDSILEVWGCCRYVLFAVVLSLTRHEHVSICLKGANTAYMKRLVIKTILNLCAEAILIAAIVAVVIGILGYIKQWNSSITYSNAFFLAGCLFIIAGGLSRFAAGQERNVFQSFSAEAFRGMSASEQANYVVNVSSSTRHVILGLLIGFLLILLSAIAAFLL